MGEVGEEDPAALPMFAHTTVAGNGHLPGTGLRPLVAREAAADGLSGGGVDLDWDLVARYRGEVSTRLVARQDKEGTTASDEVREQLGVEIIEEFIRTEAERLVSAGEPAWSPAREAALKTALFDGLFGLGRLQPLVDNDEVENIIVIARGKECSVWLEKTDGTLTAGPAIADSEDELREFLAYLGARQNRPFTEARPGLHLRLPGGARLAAASWVTAHTSVVIRRHRLIEVSMAEMVYQRRACSPVLADFLAAAVRAGKSIVVSGVQGSGKTTWVRALCSCIPAEEMIGTFETEFELHLHELVDRHQIV
ncbi:MAG: ATPase, T2SS/T4P/T4SS family, partial [Nocardioides sp.]